MSSETRGRLLPDRVTGIIFDVDGTLYDGRRLRTAMLRSLLGDCIKNPRSGFRTVRFLHAYRKAHESLRHQPGSCTDLAARQLEAACKRTGFPTTEAQRIVATAFHAAPAVHLRRLIQPGLTELLTVARSRGIRLGVYSDYPAAAKLAAMDLSRYFDVVFSSDDPRIGRLKPDPAGLSFCLSQLGTSPEHSLYVGDRPDVDAECARRAGVCPVIVGAGARTGDSAVFVQSFEQLTNVLLSHIETGSLSC